WRAQKKNYADRQSNEISSTKIDTPIWEQTRSVGKLVNSK
ncbi:10781_t:CDS:1, partial [Gigaspora margarita]